MESGANYLNKVVFLRNMMNSLVDKYKKAFYNGKINDKKLIVEVLNPNTNLNNLKKTKIIQENEDKLDELMGQLADFFRLLNKEKIYQLDLERIIQNKDSIFKFTKKYSNLILFLDSVNSIENKKLRTYLISNLYRSGFEMNRLLVKDLVVILAIYIRGHVDELANNEDHKKEIIKTINLCLDKNEKYGVSHFLVLVRLFDRKFNTKFTEKFEKHLNIELRNSIAHEKVSYEENGIFSESKQKLVTNTEVIDEFVNTYLFFISYLYNTKGIAWAFYKLFKEYNIEEVIGKMDIDFSKIF